MSKPFEIDLSLIDSLEYMQGDPNEIVDLSPLMVITKGELKELIRTIVTEDKAMLEKMKYV